jgi:levanase/fructan beta-fructosidase
MNMKTIITLLKHAVILCVLCVFHACNKEIPLVEKPITRAPGTPFKIEKKYLNFPVSHDVPRSRMTFHIEGEDEAPVMIRMAASGAHYWVFRDVSALIGKTIEISYEGDPAALKRISQSDEIVGADLLYHEANRPQYHFTTRRGWTNDPNGLVWHNGEYHLFYQHTPYENDTEYWGMHWGHAVSRDLVHWTELDIALRPSKAEGTIASGSGVVDYANTSGLGKGGVAPLVVFYTSAVADGSQCMAYSLDDGRTFTKYEGNPILDSKARLGSGDIRDPKVFWYAPGGWWVMVLYELDGRSIYTSPDLKEWTYKSHTTGFFECPEFFELPVDGDPTRTMWVMYGAGGTYMLGSFDGSVFTPLNGKYLYMTGSFYAAQTFTGTPDGRRIQMAWAQISHPGMPFRSMMTLPTELTLRTTKDGPRMFSEPVAELGQLFSSLSKSGPMSSDAANEFLKKYSDKDRMRLKMTIKLSHATNAGLDLNGQRILEYDLSSNKVNGNFYSPEDMTSMELTADIYIDRTSVEVFIDGGALGYIMGRSTDPGDGFRFWGNRTSVEVVSLEVFDVASAWTQN